MIEDLPVLSPAEARVLGCLIEKKELTPDVYPLTLNALVSAANQKTAREPIMSLDAQEIRRALAGLEQKGLVRQSFASRVERYDHAVAQRFSLTRAQIALIGLLLLRGPQTAHELHARAERMAKFEEIDALRTELDMLTSRRPPLVVLIERQPGQREERYAHLLSGEVVMPIVSPSASASPSRADLEARVAALEEQVGRLTERLDAFDR